jgi:hypothetical protein|tara:strand:+ start:1693 stop:1899 length:207 start_codon:yes stop_codon:yes gene_type:complete
MTTKSLEQMISSREYKLITEPAMRSVTIGIMKDVEAIITMDDIDNRVEAWGEFLDALDIKSEMIDPNF